jgi:hypothetical protein
MRNSGRLYFPSVQGRSSVDEAWELVLPLSKGNILDGHLYFSEVVRAWIIEIRYKEN